MTYNKLVEKNFTGILYAYGDYENWKDYGVEITKRIKLVKEIFNNIPEITLRKNLTGTPKHPIVWQLQKLKPEIKTIITNFNGGKA